MSNPSISVIVTSFNREVFIASTLDSILQSTYKDFEVVVCDDASTDATVHIVKEYCRKDSRVKLFVNAQNLGDYANRNKAASYSRGAYLKYVDSDDLIYPHTLEQMMFYMQCFPEAGWGMSIDTTYNDQPFPVCLSAKEAYMYYYQQGGLFSYSPLRAIIKSDLFYKAGGFPEKRMVGDFEMWHRLAKLAGVILLPGGMSWYRKHPHQEVSDIRKYAFMYEMIKIQYLKMSDVPLLPEEVKRIISKRKLNIVKILLRSLLKGNLQECLFRLKLLKLYY